MRGTRTAPRRMIRFLVAGLCLVFAAAGLAYAVQPAKPGITLGVQPASRSVTRGQAAAYTISVTSTGGFAGPVTLGTTGAPRGTSTSSGPLTLTSGSTATTTLTVSTSAGTPIGSFTFTVQGTGSKVSGTASAGLTVNLPLSSSIALAATPASLTLAPGSTAVYNLQLTRTNFAGPVTFGVLGGLPRGATATFTPNPTTGTTSTLQITTPASASDGTYTLYLVGAGSTHFAYAAVQLAVLSSGKAFGISGNLTGQLAPGVGRPLDLTLTNPNKKPISVTNLTVALSSVTRTPYAISHNQPCGLADYKVTQYAGTYPLTVPGNGSVALSGLGVPAAAWPRVAMLDTASNQDGCKGATVGFTFSGAGQGS
ncbi:COG1470 family protein [Kribbella sp. WER1]